MIYLISRFVEKECSTASQSKRSFFDFFKSKSPATNSPLAPCKKIYSNKLGANLKYQTKKKPNCQVCENEMNLIIQVQDNRIWDKTILVFQCQSDPGMCLDWEADGGGNKVLMLEEIEASYSEGEIPIFLGKSIAFNLVGI